MSNVNDLNRTSRKAEDLINSAPTQQEISLSSLKDNTGEQVININATNGITGVAEEEKTNRPTININTRRKIHRRSVDEIGFAEVKEVNPDDYIEKHAPVKSETPRDKAMNLLADAVIRKQKEYKEFVSNAIEKDRENREMVESGLESVEGEVQYMPDALHVPMSDDEKVEVSKNNINKIIREDRDSFEDDDFDDGDFENNDLENTEELSSNYVRINNNAFDVPSEEDEDTEMENDNNSDFEQLTIDNNQEEVINDEISNDDSIKSDNTDPDNNYTEEDDSVDEDYHDGLLSKSINVTSSALNNPISNASTSDFEMDEEDLEGLSESTGEELSDEEIMKISNASEKHLKSEILQKIIQAGKTIDTTQFIVSNKVINIKEALKGNTSNKVERTAIWPLTYAGRPYKASALKGPEIAMLADADNSDSNNGVGLTLDQARIMFEHDANPYRPSTIEAWAKTIPYSDIENIFAALYVASLKGANYIPMACPKNSCQYAYLSEDVGIENMIKFNNDEVKKRFEDIKKMEITQENTGSYESVVNVINDKFAIGIKIPSIFTILYEYDALNEDFIRKYTVMVSIIQYIDYIYYIDAETNQFQPIGWKTYLGDNGKSFKSKIATYSKILKEFDDTDFTVILALINSMINKVVESRGIRYEIPSAKCPKCGATIEAREINARGLVFMRQRLVELATTPSEK